MRLKITVVAEYNIPDEFGTDGKQLIFHNDKPDVKYQPDCFINFQNLEPDENDILQNMPKELQSKIDNGFDQASWDVAVV